MVSSFVDICFDHLEMLHPCLLCFPCLPCLAVVCHSSPVMLCLFKRNDTSATPALPWCANASLYPQLGDYHHSGGICLNRGVWIEGARGGDLCWNHNTEPYTIKANTSATSTNCALLQVSVSLPALTFSLIVIEMNDIKCADVRSHGLQGDP